MLCIFQFCVNRLVAYYTTLIIQDRVIVIGKEVGHITVVLLIENTYYLVCTRN